MLLEPRPGGVLSGRVVHRHDLAPHQRELHDLAGRRHPAELLRPPHHGRHPVIVHAQVLGELENVALPVGPRQQVVEQPGDLGDVHPRERNEPLRRRRRRLGQERRGEDGVQPVHHPVELGAPLLPGIGERIHQLFAHVPGMGAEHHDPPGEEHRFLDAVRHDHERVHPGRRVAPQIHDLAAQVFGGERIERAERLVHEQDLGRDRERPREPDALLHPARQLLRVRLLEPVEADEVDGTRHGIPAGCAVHAAGFETHRHVLRHREPRQ